MNCPTVKPRIFLSSYFNRQSAARIAVAWHIALFISIESAFPGDSAGLPDAGTILQKARAAEKRITFHGTIPLGDWGKIYVSQQANSDGTCYSRMETASDVLNSVSLVNRDGFFEVFDDTALKSDLRGGDPHLPNYDAYSSYLIRTEEYLRRPCYVVTRTIPQNGDTFRIFLGSLSEEERRGKTDAALKTEFASQLRAKSIYVIDQNNGFIYVAEDYFSSGKLDQVLTYEEVNFDPVFAPDVFDIPAGVKKIILAKNSSDHLKKYIDLSKEKTKKNIAKNSVRRKPSGPGILDRAYQNLVAFIFDTNILQYVFTISAVLSIGALAVIKRKPSP